MIKQGMLVLAMQGAKGMGVAKAIGITEKRTGPSLWRVYVGHNDYYDFLETNLIPLAVISPEEDYASPQMVLIGHKEEVFSRLMNLCSA